MTWLDKARAADRPTPEETLRRAMVTQARPTKLVLPVGALRGPAGKAARSQTEAK